MKTKDKVRCWRSRAGKRAIELFATMVIVITSLGETARGADFYWDPNPDTSPLGGNGTWDTTSPYWRPGSPTVSGSFFPSEGGDNDVNIIGNASTLNLIGSAAFNDLYSGPSNGTLNAIVGNLAVLLSDGAVPSTMEIASGTTLQVSTRFFGSVPVEKLGTGTLLLDNSANNLTGGFLLRSGTLSLTQASSGSGLRSAPLDLATGTLLSATAGITLRVGTLTGSGNVSAGSLTLYVHGFGPTEIREDLSTTFYRSGPWYAGGISAGGLNVSGAGGRRVGLPGGSEFSIQTFSGALEGIASSIVVNSGAALNLFSNSGGSSGTVKPSSIAVRGGAFILDSSKSTGSTSYGRVSNTATSQLQSGTIVLVGGTAPIDESIGAVTLAAGASIIAAVQTSGALTKLVLGGISRDTNGRSTVDFRGEGGTLGSAGGPQILTTGLPSPPEAWTTLNGTDYVAYQGSTGVIPATYTPLPSTVTTTGSGLTYYTTTGSAVLGSTTFSSRGVRLVPDGEGQAVSLTGSGNLATGGLLLVGVHDYSVDASSSGGIAGTTPRYIGVTNEAATLHIGAPFRSAGQDIVKFGLGTLELTGNNTSLGSSTTNFVINQGSLRGTVDGATASVPIAIAGVILRGGVLEIANGSNGSGAAADFRSALGVGTGKVNWSGISGNDEGGGGFAAFGSDATVNIGGLATPLLLSWQQSFFVHNGHALILGAPRANARLTLQNPIALDDGSSTNPYVAREFRVVANQDPAVQTDVARVSGAISGGVNADLSKTGHGTMELTANNPFTGNVLVHEGVLQLGASGGTGEGSGAILGSTLKIIIRANLEVANGQISATDRAVLRLGGDAAFSDRVNDQATLVMEGGVLETGGLSEKLGTLIVSKTDCVIDFQDGSSVLRFDAVLDQAWSGTIRIENWSGAAQGGGADRLYFGMSGGGIRLDQLASMLFYSDAGHTLLGTARQLASGEVVPIPEPSPIFAILVGVAFLTWRRPFNRW